jgi:nicotinic acid phosphoribosyltransferase
MLGRLNPVKWIDTLLPEVLWLGMLNNDHGHRRGIRLAEALATAADRAMAPRRFDRWPLWRTLVWTNPVVAFALRRRRGAWNGWYNQPPR